MANTGVTHIICTGQSGMIDARALVLQDTDFAGVGEVRGGQDPRAFELGGEFVF